MKIERAITNITFIDFVRNYKFPGFIEYKEKYHGYGVDYSLTIPTGKKSTFLNKIFQSNEIKIASIENNRVVLYHPQYFSDMEKMIKEYENKHKTEITLKIFEEV